MPHRSIVAARVLATASTFALALGLASGCAAMNPTPPPSTSGAATIPSGETSVNALQALYDAVVAADPRITDPLATVSRSGSNTVLSLSVLVTGDEPVSTQTLTALMVAARDSSVPFDQLDLNARSAADSERLLDLRPAVAGLPDEVTVLTDGGVTIMRGDLEKL